MLLVTGTSGALGGAVAARLADRDDVLRGSREPRGPGARLVDFDRPETLPAALDGVDVLLVVSAGYAEDDVVRARHGRWSTPRRPPVCGTWSTRASRERPNG